MEADGDARKECLSFGGICDCPKAIQCLINIIVVLLSVVVPVIVCIAVPATLRPTTLSPDQSNDSPYISASARHSPDRLVIAMVIMITTIIMTPAIPRLMLFLRGNIPLWTAPRLVISFRGLQNPKFTV